MPEDGRVPLVDEAACQALAQRDEDLSPIVERFGVPMVRPGGDPLAALVSAIANQQLSRKAGATVHGRLVDTCGGEITAQSLLDLDAETIRACGFSRPKVTYLQDLAARATDGSLPLEDLPTMDDQAVLDALTEVRGIGPWTARMVLIFDLHRPDVLAKGDLGIQDAARMVKGLDQRPTPSELEVLAEPWRPVRSAACWYLWQERDRRLKEQGKR